MKITISKHIIVKLLKKKFKEKRKSFKDAGKKTPHYVQRSSNTCEGWLPVSGNRSKSAKDQNPKGWKKKKLFIKLFKAKVKYNTFLDN